MILIVANPAGVAVRSLKSAGRGVDRRSGNVVEMRTVGNGHFKAPK